MTNWSIFFSKTPAYVPTKSGSGKKVWTEDTDTSKLSPAELKRYNATMRQRRHRQTVNLDADSKAQ